MRVASLLLLASSTSVLANTFAGMFDFSRESNGIGGIDSCRRRESCSIDDERRRYSEGGSIVDRLRDDKRFSMFVDALAQDRNLRDDLEDRSKKSTVFAPTNDAFKHMEDNKHEYDHDWELSDIIRYHIVPEEKLRNKDLHGGEIMKTNLKLKSLDDRRQVIRVVSMHDTIYLNMKARVSERDIEADNGFVHGIDRVLIPPRTVYDTLWYVPTEFSTLIAAIERTGLDKELEDKNAITVFTPSNEAWEGLGYQNLAYLFGTKKGNQDLKRIVEYHVATDLAYTTTMMKEGKMKLCTLHKNKDLMVEAIRRHGNKDDEESRRHRRRNSVDESSRRKDSRRETDEDVRDFMFVINKGEANVRFTDGPAENGVLHIINEVLIPEDVDLPDRF